MSRLMLELRAALASDRAATEASLSNGKVLQSLCQRWDVHNEEDYEDVVEDDIAKEADKGSDSEVDSFRPDCGFRALLDRSRT